MRTRGAQSRQLVPEGTTPSTPSTPSAFPWLVDEPGDLCTTDYHECIVVKGILDSGSAAHVMVELEALGCKVQQVEEHELFATELTKQ